jgi:protein ImuA
MTGAKADIIAQLKREILPLERSFSSHHKDATDGLPIAIANAFPNGEFPLGAIHEFIVGGQEDAAATGGFISGVLSSLMLNQGAAIWISPARTIFPPALASFGIAPEKIIFIELRKEKEILWAVAEALKCNGLVAVVGEITGLSFKASRQLQLAVEESHVTGFIIRRMLHEANTTACVSRWKINSLPSIHEDGMPGIGFPRWNVELLKVRNGKPGKWEITFEAGQLRHTSKIAAIVPQQQKKTG